MFPVRAKVSFEFDDLTHCDVHCDNTFPLTISLVPMLLGGGEKEPGTHCLCMCLITTTFHRFIYLCVRPRMTVSRYVTGVLCTLPILL